MAGTQRTPIPRDREAQSSQASATNCRSRYGTKPPPWRLKRGVREVRSACCFDLCREWAACRSASGDLALARICLRETSHHHAACSSQATLAAAVAFDHQRIDIRLRKREFLIPLVRVMFRMVLACSPCSPRWNWPSENRRKLRESERGKTPSMGEATSEFLAFPRSLQICKGRARPSRQKQLTTISRRRIQGQCYLDSAQGCDLRHHAPAA